MAEESDGMPDMVSEDQPIDLSRTPRKNLRHVPPLIPIRLLRTTGYNYRKALRHEETTDSALQTKAVVYVPDGTVRESGVVGQDWRDKAIKEETEGVNNDEVSKKRVRLENGQPNGWLSQRLDRARSVPQLTPLPLPLQRFKSLSESRIPEAAATPGVADDGSDWRLDQLHEEELRQRLEMATALQTSANAGGDNEALLESSWIYVGYYSQMMRRFQAQELLRQFALQHQNDSEEQRTGPIPSESTNVSPIEDGDMKRRAARPLTGKHVRPGTGASPATLLSLRRKIQARQKQHCLNTPNEHR